MATNEDLKLLRQLRTSHGRAKTHYFVAEGLRMCQSLIEAGAIPQKLFVEQRLREKIPLGPPMEVVSAKFMRQASEMSTPSGLVGIFSAPPLRNFRYEGQFTLVLDTIQNPGNLGTIARTADWFGVRQLLCSPECADLYSSKALQSTMGAIAHISVRYEPLDAVLDALPTGFPIIALDMGGTQLSSFQSPSQGVILVGSEGRGLAPSLVRRATEKVTIPSVGSPAVDSLNAAIATGILLSHVGKRRL